MELKKVAKKVVKRVNNMKYANCMLYVLCAIFLLWLQGCGDSPTTVTNNNSANASNSNPDTSDKGCKEEVTPQPDGEIWITTICDGEVVKTEEITANASNY